MGFRSYKSYLKTGVTLLSYHRPWSVQMLNYRDNQALPLAVNCQSKKSEQIRVATSLMPANSRGFHTSVLRLKIHGMVICMRYPYTWPKETVGIIVKWYKEEGDMVYPGDLMIKINKDISVFYHYSYNARYGKIIKILVPAETEVQTGHFIALIMEPQWGYELPLDFELPVIPPPLPAYRPKMMWYRDPWADYGLRDFHPRFIPERKVYRDDHGLPGTPATDHLLGPAVRNTLRLYGLAFSQVPLSGGFRNLTKGDILRLVHVLELKPLDADDGGPVVDVCKLPKKPVYVEKEASASEGLQDSSLDPPGKAKIRVEASSTAAYTDIEVTSMRKTIAKRLLKSKTTIPHAFTTVDSRINKMIDLRKRMKDAGLSVSVNDFIIKSVANALVRCPNINVVFEGTEVVQKKQIDISIAVSTDRGLITPIVTDVTQKDILQISRNVKELTNKAKKGYLQPAEFMGGTFTISNLGMFGVHHFSAIINPPQCAILAVGGGHTYLDANGREETRLKATLSYDARVITPNSAAKFLAYLKHELETTTETSMGIYNIQSQVSILELMDA